jgi:uncharacterized protein with HEPN domain
MDNAQKKRLYDILNCINNIESYLGEKKIFEVYDSNRLLHDAVERNLITIGEAMTVLLKLDKEIAITNSRKIIDARNKLSHGYDEIENLQVWNIIITHLPTLEKEIKGLLNE